MLENPVDECIGAGVLAVEWAQYLDAGYFALPQAVSVAIDEEKDGRRRITVRSALPHIALSMKTIHLIRHGETQANRDGVFRGRGEVPLSPAGLKQARELQVHFAALPVQRVFSSPLQRAAQTAAACFPGRAVELQELLNNLDLGPGPGAGKRRSPPRSRSCGGAGSRSPSACPSPAASRWRR